MNQFKIVDHPETYAPELRDKKGHPVHLYAAAVSSPLGRYSCHVLARTKDDAISQARCGAGIPEWQTPDEWEADIQTLATKIPLLIRGWGENQF